jgi:hypothetical protein
VLGLAAGVTVLLALVAVASRGDGASLTGGGGPSDTLWDYLLSTYLVLGTVTFFVLLFVLARERETLPTRRTKHRQIRHLFQFALVMLVLFFGARYLAKLLRNDDSRGQMQAQPQRADDKRRTSEPAPAAQEPRFRWEPVIALGALGAVAVAALLARRARRRTELTDEEFADALADVLDDALADLRAERDPRRAIIAAYARMERLFAVHGVPRHPAEAPFEYLARVLVELRASASSVFELTALFERAKFSTHEIDPAMRDEALAALAAVRDELREPERIAA